MSAFVLLDAAPLCGAPPRLNALELPPPHLLPFHPIHLFGQQRLWIVVPMMGWLRQHDAASLRRRPAEDLSHGPLTSSPTRVAAQWANCAACVTF
jgi:hypothetical protein